MHVNQGNVGLSDGSVQQFSNAGLPRPCKIPATATNTWRIALPE